METLKGINERENCLSIVVELEIYAALALVKTLNGIYTYHSRICEGTDVTNYKQHFVFHYIIFLKYLSCFHSLPNYLSTTLPILNCFLPLLIVVQKYNCSPDSLLSLLYSLYIFYYISNFHLTSSRNSY